MGFPCTPSHLTWVELSGHLGGRVWKVVQTWPTPPRHRSPNRGPRTGWCESPEVPPLTAPEAPRPRSRCQWCRTSSEGSSQQSFLACSDLLVVSWQHSVLPPSSHGRLPSVCVCAPLSPAPDLDPSRSNETSLRPDCSTQTLFTQKVPFAGPGS